MLPFLVGTVTLGAVGYGLKKYIESDVDRALAFDEKVSDIYKSTMDTIDELEEKGINFLDSLVDDCDKEDEIDDEIEEEYSKDRHDITSIDKDKLNKEKFDMLYKNRAKTLNRKALLKARLLNSQQISKDWRIKIPKRKEKPGKGRLGKFSKGRII